MKVKGRRTRRKIIPGSSTTIEKSRPRSVWKVMSPKQRVDITVSVQ
jgi:hypothetical protein